MKNKDIAVDQLLKKLLRLVSISCANGTSIKVSGTNIKNAVLIKAVNDVYWPDDSWTRRSRAAILEEYGSQYYVSFDGAVHDGMVVSFLPRSDQPEFDIVDHRTFNPSETLANVEQLFGVTTDVIQILKTGDFMYMIRADDQTLEEIMPIFKRMNMQDVEIVKTTEPSTLIGFLGKCIK